MKTLKKENLKLGGFTGLKEHRLVTDIRLFGKYKLNDTWNGLGNCVYLADANFMPNGETKMHDHKEVDVISLMVNGRIMHEGSLKNGQMINTNQVQVQRAGGDGFSHNEINPDNKENRMIQLWILPEKPNQKSGYKLYDLKSDGLTRVYGGKNNQDVTFDNNTLMDIGIIKKDSNFSLDKEFILYITKDSGVLNNLKVEDGDIIRDVKLDLYAHEDMQIILIYNER